MTGLAKVFGKWFVGRAENVLDVWFGACARVRARSPNHLGREVPRDQLLVVRPELGGLRRVVRLGIQVIRVERLDRLEVLVVVGVHEVSVSALAVPWVERVEAEHGEGLTRQRALVLADVVDVLCVVVSIKFGSIIGPHEQPGPGCLSFLTLALA
jgi:hypothetical protein